jgi:prepilin-type N-terminal cleavage/methylation domain-containing protein
MKVTKYNRSAGFTLVEIMIVVAIIGLLAAIAIPNFVRARQTAQSNACINNLRQIDNAKQQWALENGGKSTDSVSTTNVLTYVGKSGLGGTDVCCPLAVKGTPLGNYSAGIGTVGTLPQCAAFNTTTHPATLNPDITKPGS